jgi:ABC-type transporter Mla subunit MlaD
MPEALQSKLAWTVISLWVVIALLFTALFWTVCRLVNRTAYIRAYVSEINGIQDVHKVVLDVVADKVDKITEVRLKVEG